MYLLIPTYLKLSSSSSFYKCQTLIEGWENGMKNFDILLEQEFFFLHNALLPLDDWI